MKSIKSHIVREQEHHEKNKLRKIDIEYTKENLLDFINEKHEMMFELGVCYEFGYDITKQKDIQAAISCYTIAANAGNTKAQYYLAVRYRDGDGVSKDLQKAFELFTKAADAGNSCAHNMSWQIAIYLVMVYKKMNGRLLNCIVEHQLHLDWCLNK